MMAAALVTMGVRMVSDGSGSSYYGCEDGK